MNLLKTSKEEAKKDGLNIWLGKPVINNGEHRKTIHKQIRSRIRWKLFLKLKLFLIAPWY